MVVLQREQILNHVWGYNTEVETNVVDVYIRYLRNKLKLNIGYRHLRHSFQPQYYIPIHGSIFVHVVIHDFCSLLTPWRRVRDSMMKQRKLKYKWMLITTFITFITIVLFCLVITYPTPRTVSITLSLPNGLSLFLKYRI
jgi:hypothetical protein